MHRFVEKLTRFFALLGGITLTALIMLICLSVLGRSLNGVLHSDLVQSVMPGVAGGLLALGIGPINGDYEIVEAGIAFAIFAFLPICQLRGGHASVDIFTSRLPEGPNRVLRTITDAAFAGVLILLAWYLLLGGLSKMRSGQTTLLLEFPVWWAYAFSIVALWVAAFVASYVALRRISELISGEESIFVDDGADH